VKRYRVGVVGATGYGGAESVRLLARHPGVELTYISSETYVGQRLDAVLPGFTGFTDLVCEAFDPEVAAARCDAVFLARTDAGWSMQVVRPLLDAGLKVVDFSADFRFKDPSVYSQWYKRPHAATDLMDEAAYGIPELWRDQISSARLVGNPGCYPTGALLALAPLARRGLARDIAISAASGVSGAGRSKITLDYHYPEANESARPYGVAGHRHRPEIEQGLSMLSGQKHTISFVPHLIPMTRGIVTTAFVGLAEPLEQAALEAIYQEEYAAERFVHVLTGVATPDTKHVLGSNNCHVAVVAEPRTNRAIVMSAIDNLTKGQAGQAVQCLNAMLGMPEASGLDMPSLYP